MSQFDVPIDRSATHSLKWCGLPADDVIPLCVADMEFLSPPPVIAALAARAAHGVFGYTGYPDGFFPGIIDWVARRYAWAVEESWIGMHHGVVASLCSAIRAFTSAGDRVIIQSPVYYPFFAVVQANQREVVENRLLLEDGAYRMDFAALAAQAETARLLILCNPHNPVGRVWTPEELTQLGRICQERGVVVISDDIHSDFAFARPYVPFAALAPEFAQASVTCLSPSKTFNIAGLDTSYEITPNPALRETLQREKAGAGVIRPNLFGIVAMAAAYRDGTPWLEEVGAYLAESRRLLRAAAARWQGVRLIEPEGTYLAWLDCRDRGRSSKALADHLLRAAKVRLIPGRVFGPPGEGFLRLNYATTHATLKACLERIGDGLAGLE